MFQGINAIEFSHRFQTNDDCFVYLMKLKWGKGFRCAKCQCEKWGKGRTRYYKRCKQCGYDESVLANTIFHDLRIPVLKAFYMIFRIVTKKKGISTIELASEVGVQQKTAWLFKRKVQAVMEHRGKKKLKGDVVADETLIGGGRAGSYGRTHEEKSIVFISIEKLSEDQTGNIALEPMKDFTFDSMIKAVSNNVEKTATLYVDNFPTNRAVENKRPNTELVRSKGSTFFDVLHKQVMLFKMWLTGIHHRVSQTHLTGYTSEYSYRFNRRNQRRWIFKNLVAMMVAEGPTPHSALPRCELTG